MACAALGLDSGDAYFVSTNVRSDDWATRRGDQRLDRLKDGPAASPSAMNTFLSAFAVVVLGTGCVGYGSFLLAATRADAIIEDRTQRFALSFVLGTGFVGWVIFFPGVIGIFGPATFWAIALVGIILLLSRRDLFRGGKVPAEFSKIDFALLAVLAVVLVLDILEGISPPADADTLAYHFTIPRDFLNEGEIGFVPRAVSGAIPLLVHMTYGAAIALGGELALTLWSMLTGWATGMLLYAIARPFISRSWALALLIVFLTTPAVLYGGGNGQVEIRCAGFALACAFLIVGARRYNSHGMFALAGACAGFFIGAKFYGLAFAGAAGLFVLFSANGIRRAAVFSAAAVLFGFQWYFWNWLHTGDPVFPVLTNLLQFPDSAIWTREFGVYFSAFMDRGELPLERTLYNWVLYPVYATFNLVAEIEGGRTGLGIIGAVLLPFAIAGLFRRDIRRADFTIPLLIGFVFFTVWFFSGTAQRTRHLLPLYPLVLIGMFSMAAIFSRQTGNRAALITGLGAVIALQLAGQAVFTYNYAIHVLSDETRTQFLFRNVPGATSADWINRNLTDEAKVAYMNRQLGYLIERPGFSMHKHIQTVVDARPTTGDESRFIRQVRGQGITHLLLPESVYGPAVSADHDRAFDRMIRRLVAAGCLAKVATIETIGIRSRTLSQFGDRTTTSNDGVFAVRVNKCSTI